MNEVKLEELSDEALLKREKMVNSVTYTLGGMLLILLCLGIYLTFKKGFTPLTVIPIALSPIILTNLNIIKKIKAERKLRGL